MDNLWETLPPGSFVEKKKSIIRGLKKRAIKLNDRSMLFTYNTIVEVIIIIKHFLPLDNLGRTDFRVLNRKNHIRYSVAQLRRSLKLSEEEKNIKHVDY